MFRLCIKASLTVGLALAALTLVARVMGSTQPTNPVLSGFGAECDDNTKPCWYGIVLGETTAAEARAVLEARGFAAPELPSDNLIKNNDIYRHPGDESGCTVSLGRIGQMPYISVNRPFNLFSINCSNLNLGEIMVALGIPDWVELCGSRFRYRSGVGLVNFEALETSLSLYNHHVRLFLERKPATFDETDGTEWHGFAPCWRYKQLGTAGG